MSCVSRLVRRSACLVTLALRGAQHVSCFSLSEAPRPPYRRPRGTKSDVLLNGKTLTRMEQGVQWLLRCAVAATVCSGCCGVQWLLRCAVAATVCSGCFGVQWLLWRAVAAAVCSGWCGVQWLLHAITTTQHSSTVHCTYGEKCSVCCGVQWLLLREVAVVA